MSQRIPPLRGKNPYENRVIQNVFGLSIEKIVYTKAKREWEYRGEVTDYGELKNQVPKPAKCQFCGHQIRYGFRLHNLFSQNVVEVGSECIDNFLMITPQLSRSLETDKRAAKKQRTNRILKQRRAIYSGATREVLRIKWGIESEAERVCVGDVRQMPRPLKTDWERVASVSPNAKVFFDRITDAKGNLDQTFLPALARKYRVPVNIKKIEAFVEEARSVAPNNRLSAF